MSKYKSSFLIILCASFFVSCASPTTVTTATKTSSKAKASPTPEPDANSEIVFTVRKDAVSYLRCQMDALQDGPSLLQKEVDEMEKAKPPVSDKDALAKYNRHINDFIRIYPVVLTSCKTKDTKIQKILDKKRANYITIDQIEEN